MTDLVLGWGHPLRRDDGVGWVVAERARAALGEAVEVAAVHQLTPELAPRLARRHRVVLVDAAAEGPPGAVSCRLVEASGRTPELLLHELAPEDLLSLARLYGEGPGQTWLLTVAGADWGAGEGLSPAVAAALPEVERRIVELLAA